MKILITGANGLLGQKLITLYAKNNNVKLLATGRGKCRMAKLPKHITYQSMDINNRVEVYDYITDFQPDTIMHTAAMTNVDQCEEEPRLCWQVNVNAVKHLVSAAEKSNAHFIHLSTDFIFDGTKGSLTEDAIPHPVNYYGESKLAAEEIVNNAKISSAIVRTILVYGISHDMSRSNIVLWVKECLENGKNIQLVNDQWRTPTLAEDLAIGCKLIADSKQTGVFNISGKDMLTPYQMAIKTADFFSLDKSLIEATDGTKFKQKAKRPPKTGFVIDKAINQLGYSPRSFEEGIAIMASQLETKINENNREM